MKERWLALSSPVILLALWEVLARAGVLDQRFFSMPSEIFVRLAELVQDGTLLTNTAITLRRVAVGFVLATVPAILLGVTMGVSATVRAIFTPLVAAIYPVPKIALVPMVVIVLGIGEPAKYAIVVISVFFLVVLNTAAGVRNIDPKYFDIARNNGANKWDQIWTVALPGALPSILTGVNLGLGFALTVIVGTELLLPQGGLGALIWAAYQVYDIPTIFAVLIVVALLGFAFNWVMQEVENQLVPWRANVQTFERSNVRTREEPRLRRFVRVWWMATRPFSFTASVVPVVLGATLSAYDGYFNFGLFVLTLMGSVLIHAGTNLANDYFDWKKGADTKESLGPNRALQEGMLTPQQVFNGALICFGLGAAIGLFIVFVTQAWFILVIGVLSILAGWFYTAGPRAFAYTGLGEVVVFIFMGPIMVIGSYYVQAHSVPLHVIVASLPIGFLVAAILHANNMRDLDGDLAKNKRTLANILGRRASQYEYLFLVGGSFAVLGLLVLTGYAPVLALLPVLVLPTAVSLIRKAFATDEPQKLNRVLRATATLHGRFGWLMILGFAGALVGRLV